MARFFIPIAAGEGDVGPTGPIGPTGPTGPGVAQSTTAPESPDQGDLWYHSGTGKTYIFYDSVWVEV